MYVSGHLAMYMPSILRENQQFFNLFYTTENCDGTLKVAVPSLSCIMNIARLGMAAVAKNFL